ncbi:MAG: hypothetical protein ACM3U2_19280 [Deltaproteobacteria bacterium]
MSELMVLKTKYIAQTVSNDARRKSAATAEGRELTIFRALQKRLWMEFKDAPLSEFVKQLASRCEINIVIDTVGLEDEGLTTNTRVSAVAQGTRASTLLDQILSQIRLDYLVKDDVLKITSQQKAHGEMITVNYSVADLLPREIASGTAPLINSKPLDDVVETITKKVAPESWEKVSGPGSIMPYRTTLSLVIRQTPVVHEEIARFLKELRKEQSVAARDATSKAVRTDVARTRPTAPRQGRTIEALPDPFKSEPPSKTAPRDGTGGDPVAQFEERIKKLEGELAGLREALRELKPTSVGETKEEE